jgi:hypothetical protein
MWVLFLGLLTLLDAMPRSQAWDLACVVRFLAAFGRLLPCPMCSAHFAQTLKEDFDVATSKRPSEYFPWGVGLRAKIAARVGKPARSVQECLQTFDAQWFKNAWHALQIITFAYPLQPPADLQTETEWFLRQLGRIFPSSPQRGAKSPRSGAKWNAVLNRNGRWTESRQQFMQVVYELRTEISLQKVPPLNTLIADWVVELNVAVEQFRKDNPHLFPEMATKKKSAVPPKVEAIPANDRVSAAVAAPEPEPEPEPEPSASAAAAAVSATADSPSSASSSSSPTSSSSSASSERASIWTPVTIAVTVILVILALLLIGYAIYVWWSRRRGVASAPVFPTWTWQGGIVIGNDPSDRKKRRPPPPQSKAPPSPPLPEGTSPPGGPPPPEEDTADDQVVEIGDDHELGQNPAAGDSDLGHVEVDVVPFDAPTVPVPQNLEADAPARGAGPPEYSSPSWNNDDFRDPNTWRTSEGTEHIYSRTKA